MFLLYKYHLINVQDKPSSRAITVTTAKVIVQQWGNSLIHLHAESYISRSISLPWLVI